MTDMSNEEVTRSDGATELHQEGEPPEPVAREEEDEDPLALAGEELPDEDDAP